MMHHILKLNIQLKSLKLEVGCILKIGADVAAVGGGRGSQSGDSIVQMLDIYAIHFQSSSSR